LQWEVPLAAIVEAIRIANRAHVPVVMNPSPVREGFPWGQCEIEVLIVNSSEASAIVGLNAGSLRRQLTDLRSKLARKRCRWLVVTRGGRPTLVVSGEEWFEVSTFQVTPVDTVGAGDTFAGALATRLAEGAAMPEAVRFANCAGALATLKVGAQDAIPRRAKVQRFMRSTKIQGIRI
jgi:ribokinase